MSTPSKISAEKPKLSNFKNWLSYKQTIPSTSYEHFIFSENPDIPEQVWNELSTYIKHAHSGPIERLRSILNNSLHPLKINTKSDPAFGYPEKLNIKVLQGFFGDILAGIILENNTILGESEWQVPVHLFRSHDVLFSQLEEIKQNDNWSKNIPGRPGDDNLAFKLDEHGKIISWAYCEAKCTGSHDSQLINDCFTKLSKSSVNIPVDLLRLIEALKDYDDDQYSKKWANSLSEFYTSYYDKSIKTTRLDFGLYAYSQKPKRNNTWIPANQKHSSYKSRRPLVAVEVFIENIIEKIKDLYGKK